jgi:hypothetical protein
MSRKDHINDLVRQIIQVCAGCPHRKTEGGQFICDRKKSECHSGRVRRWLAEIEKLKAERR